MYEQIHETETIQYLLLEFSDIFVLGSPSLKYQNPEHQVDN